MRSVMIIGGPGSGKSTLARALGDRTGLPVHHMDHIHWQPGWIQRDTAERDRLTHEVHMRDRWIFEGGHSRTYAERIARADTILWLDVPIGLRLWRVLRRLLLSYGQTRPDLPDGCPEQISRETFAFLAFILRTRRSARARHLALFRDPPPGKRLYRLRGIADCAAFLATLDGPPRAD